MIKVRLSKMKGSATDALPADARTCSLGLQATVGLLFVILVGCAGRGPAPDAMPAPDTLESQEARATLALQVLSEIDE